MKPIQSNKTLRQGLSMYHKALSNDRCDTHDTRMMKIDGELICPTCFLEEENKRLEKEVNENIKNAKKNEKKRYIKKSVINDELTLAKTFNNWVAKTEQEKAVGNTSWQVAIDLSNYYATRQQYIDGASTDLPPYQNVWMLGEKGSGKTHLSAAILNKLNNGDHTCLFVSLTRMLRLVRDSFSNGTSKENEYVELCINADFLVIDDVGAESGSIEGGQATEYTQRMLTDVLDGRQSKPTIITTNLDIEGLASLYDARLVSRMSTMATVVDFSGIDDKRIKGVQR